MNMYLLNLQRFTGNQLAKIHQQRDSNPEYKDFSSTEVQPYQLNMLLSVYVHVLFDSTTENQLSQQFWCNSTAWLLCTY